MSRSRDAGRCRNTDGGNLLKARRPGEGTYPADGFHEQSFARAQQYGELYVYRVRGAHRATHSAGRADVVAAARATRSHDPFLPMDLYLGHECASDAATGP